MDIRNRKSFSVALIIVGIALACVVGSIPSTDAGVQAQGAVIDYGDYDTIWTDADLSLFTTEQALLEHICDENGLELTMAEDGTVSSIGDLQSSDERTWNLWVVYPGSTTWVKLDAPYDQGPSEFTVSSWSYLSEGDKPTVAVDYNGNPIYGFQQKYRVVTLSPTLTEIAASLNAVNVLVGVDSYSNYPESVNATKDAGKIATVGTYTGPSFELIMGTNPDVVFCDGSQRSHMQMSAQLRDVDIDAMLLYPGEDVQSILDNIFIIGTVMNYEIAAKQVINETNEVLDQLSGLALGPDAGPSPDVMISLEPDISPWVSGDGTYMDNIVELFNADNVFSEWGGWVHITSDRIPYENPDLIIVVTTEYAATQEEYDYLYSHLSAQWKDTDAWKSGNVYVLCEGAAEMAQRFGPRTAQMAELVAMILHPPAFENEVPKFIGDDYEYYLSYSSYMSID